MRRRQTAAWTKWRGVVAEQQQSGHSVTAFCRERGLRTGQFFAWKKRLREAETPKFVAVEVAPVAETKVPAPEIRSGVIEVRLRSGRSLMVEPGFDAHHLRALVLTLEADA